MSLPCQSELRVAPQYAVVLLALRYHGFWMAIVLDLGHGQNEAKSRASSVPASISQLHPQCQILDMPRKVSPKVGCPPRYASLSGSAQARNIHNPFQESFEPRSTRFPLCTVSPD